MSASQPAFLRNKETGELTPIDLPPQPKPKNLVQKLCEVMAAVGYLQKKGDNKAQDYKYVREADVVDMVRGEFAKRNLFVFPTLLKHDRIKLSAIKYDKVVESFCTDIIMRWTIVDGDNGEERFCDIPGCSASPGDKQIYVAMTGSEKFFLMKSLLLPTGDDPENDDNEPTGSKDESKALGEAKSADLRKKMGKPEPKSDYVPSLFYTWHDESQSAEISGAEQLKTLHKPYLKQFWNPSARALVVNAEQLENMKYEFEKRGVPFHPLKAM